MYCVIVVISCLSAQNTSCSSMDDFECGNGDCIKYTLTCDGMAHCKDKSDEKQSYCSECVCVCYECSQRLWSPRVALTVCVCVQLTVCVRRAISAAWTDAVSDTVPGVTAGMIAAITLTNSSVMVRPTVHIQYISVSHHLHFSPLLHCCLKVWNNYVFLKEVSSWHLIDQKYRITVILWNIIRI